MPVIFDFLTFLSTWLAGIKLDQAAIQKKLDELAVQYPDAAERAKALATWLEQLLAPVTDVAALRNTLQGIAQDIVSGKAGVDPNAGAGSV